MNCTSCGQLNEVTAQHCQVCGELLSKTVTDNEQQQETAAAVESGINTNAMPGASSTSKTTEQAERTNEYVEKSKEMSKMYIKYAWDILRKPNQQAFTKDHTHLLNGLISIGLFSVFFSLATYFLMRKVLNISFLGNSLYKVSFFDGAAKPFLMIVVLIAIVGTALYGALLLQRMKVGYKEALAKWLAYLVIPVALSAISFIFALIGVIQLASMLLAVSMIAMFGSVPLFIRGYQRGKPSELDPLYLTLAIYIVAGTVVSIFGNSLLKSLMGSLL